MDESALKTLLDNLDASRSSLHGWLHFWTLLVVIGVALEVFFVVWEHTEALHDFRRGIVHPPEKPSQLLLVLGLMGAGLVAVGVAGELFVDVQAGKVETGIRNANELRISLLTKEAGDAKASAEGAKSAASSAEASAGGAAAEASRAETAAGNALGKSNKANVAAVDAVAQAGTARNEVANAQEKIEKLRQQSRSLETRLSEEQAKFLELAKALAPRELWIVEYRDKTSNIDKLKALAGARIFVECVPDFEAELAAEQIIYVLEGAGLRPIPRRPSNPKLIPAGVTVSRYTPASGDTSDWFFKGTIRSETVVAFLLQNNWDAMTGAPDTELAPDSIVVRVGFKANPYFQSPKIKDALQDLDQRLIKEYGFDATGKEEVDRHKMDPGHGLSYQLR